MLNRRSNLSPMDRIENNKLPQSGFSSTNCKLHCGVRAVRCLRSFLDRHVLSGTDALRNLPRNSILKQTNTDWQKLTNNQL